MNAKENGKVACSVVWSSKDVYFTAKKLNLRNGAAHVTMTNGVPQWITKHGPRGHESTAFVNEINSWHEYADAIKKKIKVNDPNSKVDMKIVGSIRVNVTF